MPPSGDPTAFLRQHISHISLIHGWFPAVVQAVAAAALLCAIGWRTRRWRLLWLPAAWELGVAVALTAYWYIASVGVAGNRAPTALWCWIGLTGVAIGVAVLGARGARWWRRAVSVLAVPLCLISSALAVNHWVGYFPTVHAAWNQLTAGPLPDQTDRLAVTAMQLTGKKPDKGVVVPVTIRSDASKFQHRGELVYLPPAWFSTTPPPRLPTVMMIAAEMNTPGDWLRVGDAVATVDNFASTHRGNAPVLVFVDATGAWSNDTECVNGSRGNAADHLTKDVVPFMVSNFRVSAHRENWGVVGWSMGGTCAVDLTVMHPNLFAAFVDIAGDLSPNTGTKTQTIAQLFDGDADAWASFDPRTVITRHVRYAGVAGWFAISGAHPEGQDAAAHALCDCGKAHGIDCAVVAQQGGHDWPFAARAFAGALPWLAGTLGTPTVARIPLA